MSTKISAKALRALPSEMIVDMLRDLDPDTGTFWQLNRELTRREWFWINTEEE